MPKATISTYTTISTNLGQVEVNNIVSEQKKVPNIQKEVNFGKFFKKLPLQNNVLNKYKDLGR